MNTQLPLQNYQRIAAPPDAEGTAERFSVREIAHHTLLPWAYRLGGYALLNLLDDAAMLALMFC